MEDLRESLNKKVRMRRRIEKLLLLAVVVINVCVFGGMWLLSQGVGAADTRSQPLAVATTVELHGAYKQALGVALGWRNDVELVSVASSWQMAAGDRLTLQRPAWSFSFYSPAARQVKVVTVDQQGAQDGPQQPVDIAPRQVSPDWSMGSEDLLLTFLSYGGQAFMNTHPHGNIHLQLRSEDGGRSVWYVTGVDPVARQTLLVVVDALSRQVIVGDTSEGGV